MNENKEPIKLAIVLTVFNSLNYTQNCLKTLLEIRDKAGLTNDKVKVILVDDGSSDGTSEWVKTHYPDVILLEGDGNLWWSGGINMAVKHAIENLKFNYTLWMNNDIKPADDYLIQLWNKLNTIDEKTIMGSKIYNKDNHKVWSMGGYFNPRTGAYGMIGFEEDDKELYKSPMESDWFPGMGTTFHKSVYEKIGYINQVDFPQYHGDSDFTYRAKLNGFKLICYPDLKMYNDTSHSGLMHQGQIRKLYTTLTGIKSFYNFNKDVKFLRLYATSVFAYGSILLKYSRYVGGFIKWKMIGWFIKRKER
jgi:GT2 family glycosyltransferase